MIIVQLIGGLGNQMFQYAAGKALALHHGTELKLDISHLEAEAGNEYTKRNFELNCFNLNYRLVSEEDRNVYFPKKISLIKRIVKRFFPALEKKNMFYEPGKKYYPEFFQLPNNTYLYGFWQSEKYFEKFASVLRAEFTPAAPLPMALMDVKKRIEQRESVSLHIRRGDYVTLKSASDFHGSCGLDYYKKAIEFLSHTKKIELFIFSDDIEWCRQNLIFDVPLTFVAQNNGACRDLYLMSLCKHNIIANSSFSWWGAWLNQNRGKIVVAPEYWFKTIKSKELDIIPDTWKVI
ncbi:MAG: alpha-1,2-fucosyltransferase [Bacteroidetes bacterium]|nr:alpha-1,2-fucosyltransferase [Bacteroidota bacterium]